MAINVPGAVGGPVPNRETAVVVQSSGQLADPSKYRNPVFYAELLAGGTGTAGTVYGPLDLSDIKDKMGERSPVHLMAEKFAAQKTDENGITLKPKADMYVCGLVEVATGMAATQTLTFTNPGAANATGNGTFIFKVGGHQIRVNVSTGDTITNVGDAFVAAYTALPYSQQSPLLPVNAAGTVTLTATVKVEHINTIGLSTLQDPDVDIVPTWGGTTMAGGLGIQDSTAQATALAALLGNGDFANYVVPWRDTGGATGTLDEILEHVISKADATNMRSSFMIYGDTVASATSISNAALLDTQDASRVWSNACEATETWNAELACIAAAVLASEPAPARSLDGLRGPGIDPPAFADKYTATDQKALLEAGVTPWVVHEGQTQVGCVRSIMTRDNWGVVDFQHVRVADLIRDDINSVMAVKLARASIIEDGKVIPNNEFTTSPAAVKALIYSRLKLAEKAGWITDVDDLFEDFVSELTITTGELRQAFPIQMVAQLHNIMTRIDVKV